MDARGLPARRSVEHSPGASLGSSSGTEFERNRRRELENNRAISGQVRATHPFEDGDGVFGEPHWIDDLVVENRLKKVVLGFGFERRLTGHHFVHQNAQRPPVLGN